jgi:hypothetical protein
LSRTKSQLTVPLLAAVRIPEPEISRALPRRASSVASLTAAPSIVAPVKVKVTVDSSEASTSEKFSDPELARRPEASASVSSVTLSVTTPAVITGASFVPVTTTV